jgi:hypothetical protein
VKREKRRLVSSQRWWWKSRRRRVRDDGGEGSREGWSGGRGGPSVEGGEREVKPGFCEEERRERRTHRTKSRVKRTVESQRLDSLQLRHLRYWLQSQSRFEDQFTKEEVREEFEEFRQVFEGEVRVLADFEDGIAEVEGVEREGNRGVDGDGLEGGE